MVALSSATTTLIRSERKRAGAWSISWYQRTENPFQGSASRSESCIENAARTSSGMYNRPM